MDSTQLLTPEQMQEVMKAAEHARALPSQGIATVYEALNVHIDPSRQSPAFARIPDGGSVEVLGHRIEPKLTGPQKVPVFTLPQSPEDIARKQRKDRKAKSSFHLPRAAVPKPPEDWQQLLTDESDHNPVISSQVPKSRQVDKQAAKKEPVPTEDWTLVRTKDKQCGWVLSRNLIMSIPDDVAQYAEGKRITSYFDLGVVADEEKGPHHNWLWTTSSEQEQTDFDAWRIFLWNRRRHRYETSYRQRDVEGYFPVHVDATDHASPVRTFALVFKEDNGKLIQKHYEFDGTRVRLTGQEAYQPAAASGGEASVKPTSAPKAGGWLQQMWAALRKRMGGSRVTN